MVPGHRPGRRAGDRGRGRRGHLAGGECVVHPVQPVRQRLVPVRGSGPQRRPALAHLCHGRGDLPRHPAVARGRRRPGRLAGRPAPTVRRAAPPAARGRLATGGPWGPLVVGHLPAPRPRLGHPTRRLPTRTKERMMPVLVTAATKYGATAEIAAAIAEVLAEHGLEATVLPPEQVKEVDGYEAVVVGSAVYAGHWLKPARELVERLGNELAGRPAGVAVLQRPSRR